MSNSRIRPDSDANRVRSRPTSTLQALSRRADEIAASAAVDAEPVQALAPADAERLIHDLRIHQIELELQNEELRNTQDALERARARYFDLYDLAPVSYFTVSEEGVILESNLTGARMLDVPRGALVNRHLSLFILPEDQDVFYRACRNLAMTVMPQAFEVRLTKSHGAPFWVWVEAATATDDDGESVWRMVMTDISYRKATEQALRVADGLRDGWTRYQQLSELLPNLVWTSDATGEWDYLGPQWMHFTGFPAEEQLGLGWTRQLHPDDRAGAIAAWNAAIAAGTMFDAEFRIRRHDGVFRRFKARAVPARNGVGVITKWVGTNTDVDAEPAAPTG